MGVDTGESTLNSGFGAAGLQGLIGPWRLLAHGALIFLPRKRALGNVFEGRLGSMLTAAQILESVLAEVNPDAIEPSADHGVPAKGLDGHKGLDENVLGHVLSLGGVAEHAKTEIEDATLVLANE